MIFNTYTRSLRDSYAALHEPEKARRLADIYWKVIVCVGVALASSAITYGAWLFLTPPTQVESEAIVSARGDSFDKAQLDTLMQALQKRQTDFETFVAP